MQGQVAAGRTTGARRQQGTKMDIERHPIEFETILRSLAGLTKEQVIDRVWQQVSPKDAADFAVLVEGLSTDAVRFLAARALLRIWLSQVTRSGNDIRPLPSV